MDDLQQALTALQGDQRPPGQPRGIVLAIAWATVLLRGLDSVVPQRVGGICRRGGLWHEALQLAEAVDHPYELPDRL